MEIYKKGYALFIRDKQSYKHILTEDIDEKSYRQEVIALCPVCGGKVKVSSLHPSLMDGVRELVWYCHCSNHSCPSEPLILKTDNPVKLSSLDTLIEELNRINLSLRRLKNSQFKR